MAARAKKDAYVEKPLGLAIEQDLACRKVFRENGRIFQYGTQQRSFVGRQEAVLDPHCWLGCELVRSGRIGKIHRLEVVSPDGEAGGSTRELPVPANLDYDMWLGPAPKSPYTADRCKPPGTYWIYDQSIGYLAGWGAHPLDIMVWGCDADLAGPMTVEGTGVIPTKGLYNVVYNFDMKIQMADGVAMTLKPGGDSTTFFGSDGWICISRWGWDAEPKSLLRATVLEKDARLIQSLNHYQNYVERREDAPRRGQPPGRRRPQRHYQPPVQHRRPPEAKDHLGPDDGNDRRRRRGGETDAS